MCVAYIHFTISIKNPRYECQIGWSLTVGVDAKFGKEGHLPCPEARAQRIRFWTIGWALSDGEHAKDVFFWVNIFGGVPFSSYWPQKLSKAAEIEYQNLVGEKRPLTEKLTRKPSCRWQTRATLAKRLHGLRKSSGVVSCITRLPIDGVPMVSYYVLYSNCVCKMRRFGDTRLLKLPWPWNPGQGSLKVIETDTIR